MSFIVHYFCSTKFAKSPVFVTFIKYSNAAQANENQSNTTIDQSEIENFNKSSQSWWDRNGSAKPLHAFNMVRVPLIREGLISTGAVDKNYINTSNVLKGVNILEVGCGGGILTEVILNLK